jgi:hypothetical protein
MSRIRRLLTAIVVPGVVMGAMAGGAISAPALADTGARPLHLAVLKLQFTSVTCLNPSCSLFRSTIVGDASSNLGTGMGSFQSTITVDASPGGTCNIVDEPRDAFIFDNGTIFASSHHEDCAIHGFRIDTTFQVVGGTGAFAGASGSGHEFSAAANPTPVIFNGTISF